MSIRPLHTNIAVKRIEKEKTTASGIILTSDVDRTQTIFEGEVVAIDETYDYGINVSDKVLYSPIGIQNTKDENNEELLIMKYTNIVAIIEE